MLSTSKLLFVCLLLTTCSAVLQVGMMAQFNETFLQFANVSSDGTCSPSFECDILDSICDYLKEECQIVVLYDLEDRLTVIENGESDIVLSFISVIPERAERVHFVRPYYYYAGAQIFVPDLSDVQPTWEDLKGKNVCVLDEYYAIPGIVSKYGANVIELENLVVENVLDGTCDYIVADSTGQIEGMVESQNSFIEFGEPYAIAVSQEQKDTLGKNISAALVDIMDDGAESEILQFEQENLVAFGFAPNKKLADIVMTITAAGGALSPELEDAIWNE